MKPYIFALAHGPCSEAGLPDGCDFDFVWRSCGANGPIEFGDPGFPFALALLLWPCIHVTLVRKGSHKEHGGCTCNGPAGLNVFIIFFPSGH